MLVAVPLCLAVYCSAQWGSNQLFSTLCLYFGTLVASLVTYRLSPFHPLASISGPKISHVSRIWSSKINKDSYQHLHYHKLLQKYGSFVRIGTRSFTFFFIKGRTPGSKLHCICDQVQTMSSQLKLLPFQLSWEQNRFGRAIVSTSAPSRSIISME